MRRRVQAALLGLVVAVSACTTAELVGGAAIGWDVWRKVRVVSGLCDEVPPVWMPRRDAAADGDASADAGEVE